jgi:microcystin-dependent protein
MQEPFFGEIRLFAGGYAPKGWALCDGRTLPISPNTALFSIIGTRYGGNGKNTFALPDLRGRAALHRGAGPGLTDRPLGSAGGRAAVALTEAQMPSHTHVPMGVATGPGQDNPKGRVWGKAGTNLYKGGIAPLDAPMGAGALQNIGQNKPHENRQPYLALNFCIAMTGIFPTRS